MRTFEEEEEVAAREEKEVEVGPSLKTPTTLRNPLRVSYWMGKFAMP